LHEWGDLARFFAPMLWTAGATGVAGAVLGVFVLLRREALVALALPQTVAVGTAIALRLGWPALPPALATTAVALVYFILAKRWGAGSWILPSFYIAGLSLSFLIIAGAGAHVSEMQNRFTGIDVSVTPETAKLVVPVLLGTALLVAICWRRWLLIAQAPAAAQVAGLRPALWDALFLALLTAAVLLGTYALGAILVLAMLFLPAATVLPWARRLPAAILLAAVAALLFLFVAFVVSNLLDWPLSQTVGGVGFAALAISHLAAQLRRG
jgi:ABC-type Mn2+/Zn2+ transport system permease subunit